MFSKTEWRMNYADYPFVEQIANQALAADGYDAEKKGYLHSEVG